MLIWNWTWSNLVIDPWKSWWLVKWPRHINCEKQELSELLRKEVSKSFSALLNCMVKVFMDYSNVKFVIDSTLRVSSMTSFHHWTRPWIYIQDRTFCYLTILLTIYPYLMFGYPESADNASTLDERYLARWVPAKAYVRRAHPVQTGYIESKNRGL